MVGDVRGDVEGRCGGSAHHSVGIHDVRRDPCVVARAVEDRPVQLVGDQIEPVARQV